MAPNCSLAAAQDAAAAPAPASLASIVSRLVQEVQHLRETLDFYELNWAHRGLADGDRE